jgi:hypothetical protein
MAAHTKSGVGLAAMDLLARLEATLQWSFFQQQLLRPFVSAVFVSRSAQQVLGLINNTSKTQTWHSIVPADSDGTKCPAHNSLT